MRKRRAERQLAGAAILFAALGDPTRLGLIRRLAAGGSASIATLAEGCPAMSRQGVTKHLQVLASAGIVQGRRKGREHLWALNPATIEEARLSLDAIARHWDDRLARLKAHVEREA